MSRTVKVLLGGTVALMLVASVAVIGMAVNVAAAQTPAVTPGAPSAVGTPASLSQNFWQALATRLGTTVDKLQQAVKDAAHDAVAQELQQNGITQDQANSLNQRIDKWTPDQGLPFGKEFGRGMMGRGHEFGFLGGQAVLDAAAQTLGMNTTDLMNELHSGKSLADIAKEKNVDMNTLKTAMVTAAKAQVDQAVQAGKLTQAQGDELKTRIDQMAANWDLSQPFFFGHKGWGGGWGGHPFGPGQTQPTPVPTAPAG